MKSFLLKDKRPIVRWGMVPDNTFFEGSLPEGYSLACSPSEGTIIIDVDRHGDRDGFENIPPKVLLELEKTLNYPTKNNGRHFWINYSGIVSLANKASGLSVDLRTHKGYVVYYPKNDIREQLSKVKESSENLNKWLEKLFGYKK